MCRGCGRGERGEGRDVKEGERCGRQDLRSEGQQRGEEGKWEALWRLGVCGKDTQKSVQLRGEEMGDQDGKMSVRAGRARRV